MTSKEFYERQCVLYGWDRGDICNPPSTDQEAMAALIEALLGKEWFDSMPENHDQCNTAAVIDILQKYCDRKTVIQNFLTNTANKVLLVLGGFVAVFIIAMIVTFWVKDSVPDTLIQYTLGAGGVECLLLAGIKISKVVKGDNDSDEES